jgi:glutathione synthase/RimK-type ligase-like ATP-grasp enzyme
MNDMSNHRLPLAIYYEHPDWFRPLFAELDRRDTPYVRLDAACHSYDAGEGEGRYALVFNRMSASAYLRGHGNAVFYTRGFLAYLERNGVRVVNGGAAFAVETSKALQLNLLASLELPFPRTRVVNRATELVEAARGLRFPVVVKPNVGGRGAGVVRFDAHGALAGAVEAGLVPLGIDDTALVQEFAPARGGHIVRVETLGGKFLYAIKVFTSGESFNLCPAEICQTEGGGGEVSGVAAPGEVCLADAPRAGLKVEAYEPPREIVAAVERIAAAARLDVGGVEYLVDDRDGQLMFYDINALSNFVADAERIVGFDPHVRLVNFLEEEVGKCATVTGSRFSAAG